MNPDRDTQENPTMIANRGGDADERDDIQVSHQRKLLSHGAEQLSSIARSAASREDWPEALEAWKCFGDLEEASLDGPLGQAEAYRALNAPTDADAALGKYVTSTSTYAPGASAEIAVSYALNAQTTGDWAEALKRWRTARLSFSFAPVIWAGEAAMLQLLNKSEEAEKLTSEAVQRFPSSIDVAAQHFNVAIIRKDWLEADLRLGAMERQFAEHEYVKSAAPAGRSDIERGLHQSDLTALLTFADRANAAREWASLAKILRVLHEKTPEDPACIIRLGYALRESEQHLEAERLLAQARIRFATLVEIHAQYAEVAATQRNWDEAARRWQETLERFPDVQVIWMLAAISFREAGMTDQADALLTKAIELQPERVELHVYQAMNSERAGNWGKAVKSWGEAHRLQPDDKNILNSRGDSIWQEAISRLESGASPAGEAASHPGNSRVDRDVAEDEVDLKRLALSFEGLGDNCEFGMVQRHFGADPVGLFRFAAISALNLRTMIDEQFGRLGDPAFTELDLTSRGEYLIRDARQFYLMHSFVQKDTVDADKFLQQQIKRLGFLKRKLLEDLRNSEKTFVYKASFGISDAEINGLHEALERFGANTLLVVRKAQDGYTGGSVRVLGDRLLVGHVETLYDSDGSPIDFASWRRILEAADSYRNDFIIERHIGAASGRVMGETF